MKLLLFILCIVLNSSLQLSVFLISSPRIHMLDITRKASFSVSRPSVKKHFGSCVLLGPKAFEDSYLEELALITTKRDSNTNVLVRVRVKKSLSNTGV